MVCIANQTFQTDIKTTIIVVSVDCQTMTMSSRDCKINREEETMLRQGKGDRNLFSWFLKPKITFQFHNYFPVSGPSDIILP